MTIAGGVIGADGVAALYGCGLLGRLCHILDQLGGLLRQLSGQSHVLAVRAARTQDLGEGVLPHEGAGGEGAEAVLEQYVAKLHQTVVKVPVAIENHRDSRGVLSLDLVLDIGQQQVGHPSGVDRYAEYHQVLGAEGQLPFPGLGQVEAEGLIRCVQRLRKVFGQSGYYFFCGAGAAEVDGPDRFDLHETIPPNAPKFTDSAEFKA